MIDRHTESQLRVPDLLSLDGVQRVLCVAVLLEDAVLGCGGLMAACAGLGASVHVVTPVAAQEGHDSVSVHPLNYQTDVRSHQGALAAEQMGIPRSSLLGFGRRVIRYDDALVQTLSDAIRQHRPQLLLLPSLSEQAGSHRALTLAGLSAACSAGSEPLIVLQYEHGVPLHANICFPIDEVAERKWAALRYLDSIQDSAGLEAHARALATLRAFGLRSHCRQAESFFKVHLEAVRERGGLAALPQWPWVQESERQTIDPLQRPLVSVLVRSMNRDCLAEALASVALQTYANVELVVVNSSGRAHRPLDFLPLGLPWRIVEPAENSTLGPPRLPGPVGRAQAANLALASARGEYALFLDDDDLLQPTHLERLVEALLAQPQAAGAYAGVRVETHDGVHVRDYDLPWSRQRLLGVNYLPIHAVLFRMDRVREQTLRFDESLPVLEDWHFWVQLTDSADLVHCPGVSATYRQGLGQSALGDAHHPHHWRIWHRRLLLQWIQQAPQDQLAEALAWHAVELDRTQADAARQVCENDALTSRLEQAQKLARDQESARQSLQQELLSFGQECQAALALKESALHLQAAEAARLLADTQRELSALQAQLHALQGRDAEHQALEKHLRAQLLSRESELKAVYASRSWRWTAPLRRDSQSPDKTVS